MKNLFKLIFITLFSFSFLSCEEDNGYTCFDCDGDFFIPLPALHLAVEFFKI